MRFIDEPTTFMGEQIGFWRELKTRADTLNMTDILRELVVSNAKVRYYESHLKLMQDFAAKADSMR